MEIPAAEVFVTVGGQTPFDRLVRAVDEWLAGRPARSAFVQIGDGDYEPSRCRWARFLAPAAFEAAVAAARVVVAHAGTGSLMAAIQIGRPILLLPRQASLGETRNEHQTATARSFSDRPGVAVAWTEAELGARLDELLAAPVRPAAAPAPDPRLLAEIRGFLVETAARRKRG